MKLNRELVRDRLGRISCGELAKGGDKDLVFANHTGHDRVGHPFRQPARQLLAAAVLVAVVGHLSGPTVILTRRTDSLQNHAGEISFPGGRVEAGDVDARKTALREAEEELGLDISKVEVLGCLPPYDTLSGFRVQPVVGWLDPPVDLRPDENEVAEVFEVPLDFLLDPVNHQREQRVHEGESHSFYVLQYEGRRIWGATAGILVGLASFLTGV